MGGRAKVEKSLFAEDKAEGFVQNFDAAGEATITKIYNTQSHWIITWDGGLSDQQEKLLNNNE